MSGKAAYPGEWPVYEPHYGRDDYKVIFLVRVGNTGS